jgi:hypothetical protein
VAYIVVTTCAIAAILGIFNSISRKLFPVPTDIQSFWRTVARQEAWASTSYYYINFWFRRGEGELDKFVITSFRTFEKAFKIAYYGEPTTEIVRNQFNIITSNESP